MNPTPTETIDALLQTAYKPTEPGAAVIVVQDGQTIFRKGYGMANLEFGIPIEADMVFCLASVTKQFTAIAILILVEQGKLNLEDSITDFVSDYPTHDYVITVEHLLTHTSGIKNYTNMSEWLPLWRKDFTVIELIDFFKHQPMEFAPGKRFSYSNSGYILLGAIIEKVSEQTYEAFVQQHIFDHLGMKTACYDNTQRVIPRRVTGYDKSTNEYTNSQYISMTQPYAAGSLAASVDDMVIWDAALQNHTLIKPQTLEQAFSKYKLLDGTHSNYGYGWMILEYQQHRMIEHSGGIHGFRTHTIRMPEDKVFVTILSNNAGSKAADPEILAFQIAALVIGKPFEPPKQITVEPEALDRFVGAYLSGTPDDIQIIRQGLQLISRFATDPDEELIPFSQTEFYFKNTPVRSLQFISDAGQVIKAEIYGRGMKQYEINKKS